jgi:hypothetical protein
VLQAFIFDRWFGLLDEGYILAIADDINRGKVLYRDIYIDAPFPGAFYLLAGWFRLVGTSILASRPLVVAAFTILVICVTRIASVLLPRAGALAVAVVLVCYRVWAFPHWQVYNYSPIAAAILTLAVMLLLGWIQRPVRAFLVIAGVLAGVGILCKQDYGLGVTGALGLFLLVQPMLGAPAGGQARPQGRRLGNVLPALQFTVGVALVLGPALGLLAWAGALGGLVEQAIVVPLRGATQFVAYPRLPALRPLLSQDPQIRAQLENYFPSILLTLRRDELMASWLWRETSVWDVGLKVIFYLPLLSFALAAVCWLGAAVVRARRGTVALDDVRRLLLLAWLGGFLLAFNRPRDWVHLMMIYPPVIVSVAVLVADGLRRAPRAIRIPARAGLSLAVALLIAASLDVAGTMRRTFTWPLESPRAGVRVDVHNGPLVDDVLAWIAANAPPGEPVSVYPIQPMIAFLAGREVAANFQVIWPVQGGDRDRRIIADLERRRPHAIVYSLSGWGHLGSFRDNAPALWRYLVEHYEIERTFSRELWGSLFCGLVRRETPATGQPLLDAFAASPEVVRRQWPFADVVAARVGTAAAPHPAAVRLHVPEAGGVFAFRFGINPDRWLWSPGGPFTFEVTVDGRTELRTTLDPARRLEDRRWVEGRIDLRALAGRDVTVALAVTSPLPPPGEPDVAGWSEIRMENQALSSGTQ